MLTLATVPALLPTFILEWSLTKTEAGWISGTYYLGYLAAVPFLVSLTDRRPVKPIYFCSLLLSGISAISFAYFADGIWTALVLRTLGGIGLAGTYMPGLKLLTDLLDRIDPNADHSRIVAFYTSSFGVGVALSYLLTGEISNFWGWNITFIILGAGPIIALVFLFFALPPEQFSAHKKPQTHLLDFRPVFRCKPAVGYILAYTVHNFELFAFRSWIVAYLGFAVTLHPGEDLLITASAITAISTLVGLPASVLGNELAQLIGRHKAITLIMWTSSAVAVGLGLMAEAPLWALTFMTIVYGILLTGDSSSITAGTVAEAPIGYKGATLAVHSCIGFFGSFLGPLVFGLALDIASSTSIGSTTAESWSWAFNISAIVAATGPVILYFLRARG